MYAPFQSVPGLELRFSVVLDTYPVERGSHYVVLCYHKSASILVHAVQILAVLLHRLLKTRENIMFGTDSAISTADRCVKRTECARSKRCLTSLVSDFNAKE